MDNDNHTVKPDEPVPPEGEQEPNDHVAPPEPAISPVTPPAVDMVPSSPPLSPAEPLIPRKNDPISLVLQWLTYAFWGWFALSILWIGAVVFAYFIVGTDSQDWASVVAYPVAAVVVLFLVAGTIDFFYARREPTHKEGIAVAIMVIHAVIFALCGIGALIVAVLGFINLLIGSNFISGGSGTWAMIDTALVLIFVYAVLIARTTLVGKLKRLHFITTGIFGLIALVFIVCGIVGPMARSMATRQDREVESALSEVVSTMSTYVEENDKLPDSLDALSLSGGMGIDDTTKSVVDRGLIEYTPNVQAAKSSDIFSSRMEYFYRLCVTYTAEKNPSYKQYESNSSIDGYSSYISTTYHPKGRTCYNLEAEGSYSFNQANM